MRNLKLLIIIFPGILYSAEYSLSQGHQKFVGNGPHRLFPYIIKESAEISINGGLLSPEYYSIDYEKGIIYLNIPINPQDTVLCTYERLPLELPKEYFHRKLGQKAENRGQKSELEEQPITDNQKSITDDRLSLIGIKTFGISLGSSHDLSFDQSMHISMNGKLSDGMRIEGTLRDDGVPLEPEGTTQELKEIDKVYVNVNTEKHKLRLGDFDFNYSHSKFGKLDRKLEGILGKSQILNHNSQMEVGGALSKGRWTRKEFTGTTGKQGPYELSPQGIIVAASERIWVNGKQMTRGKDYTIDYAAAAITFTAILPIEDGERIIAEFQQKDESYRRTSFIGNHTSDDFNVLLFREDDMKDHPLSFAITPERRESLSKADSSFAWISGATYAGDKKGTYIKKDSIYEYAGYPNGDYEVSFTRVSEGDYEFDPIIGGYKYVGNGNGKNIPKIRIPLPQSNLLVDVGYEKEVNKIKFSIEGGATKFKPNTFAQQEEVGKAVSCQVETGSSKWTVGANFRNIDKNFRFPGTPDTVEPNRGEVFLGLTPVSFIHTDTRVVKTPDDIKKGIGINLTPQKLPHLSYRYLLSRMKTLNEIGASYLISSFEPFIRYGVTNYRESQDSSRTNIGEIGINSKWVNLSTREVTHPDGYRDDSRTSSISILTTPLTLAYTYKQTFTGNRPSAVDLGNVRFEAKGFNFAYDLTSLERKMFEEEYYRVAPGEGSFSRDSTTGRYYPDPHGDYEKMLIPSDNSVIYKNFSLSHGITVHLDEEVYIKVGSLKQGEGDKIYFWKRTQNAFEDKNRISFGAKIFDIYANYSKEDHRANRINGIINYGDQNILEVNFRPNPYELIYTTRGTRNCELSNLTWQERATTVGTGISSHLSLVTCHFLLKGEERQIDEPPYSQAHLYGLSGEPTLTYQFGNSRGEPMCSPKTITARFKLIDWFTKTDVPPNVRVIYPPGISTQWGIDFTVFSQSRTNYTISYQGTKTPDYPIDHTLNAELRINF